MKRFNYAFIAACLLCLAGCDVFKHVRMLPAAPIALQQQYLLTAREKLRSGKPDEARELLERIIELPVTASVTDEALFRLAVLVLDDGSGKGEQRARDLIERLNSDFHDSIWNYQAQPLAVHLSETRELRNRLKELKTLRDRNISLRHDNRELRLSIEKLKALDIELERKLLR